MPLVQASTLESKVVDYLVVGGGTSGLVVATRLSEDPNVVVAVLEGGGNHLGEPFVDIPGCMGRNVGNPKFDWGFSTEPQKYALDRKLANPRGKGLGGSSALNFLAYIRPVSEELDAFEKLGNPGWNWKNLLGYMNKSERQCVPPLSQEEKKDLAVDPDLALHGTDGPISVSFPPYVSPIHTKVLNSLETLGLPRINDANIGRNVGSFLVPTCVNPETATRSYSGNAYLQPHLERANLLVITDAFATKIHFANDGKDLKRASSVEFIRDKKVYKIQATKEVILSAGSFQTPQILEASGIGDPRVLEPLGIPSIVNLPGVGENLRQYLFHL